jgi:transcriptional regulator GlxA family with amidase domain
VALIGAGGNDNDPAISAMTRTLAFVVFSGFQILDVTGPLAAFEIAGRFTPGAYDVRLIAPAPSPGAVASSCGVTLSAGPLGAGCKADTLLIAGGEGTRAAMADEILLDWVGGQAKTARRVASVCTGAFVLAAAGLLDGRRATTHWSRAADLARRFPKVRVEPDRIWVRDGALWTSAGITAGIDLALALIEDDLGESVARQVAQQLVVYYRRPGGQSQFSALAGLSASGGRFAPLLTWMRENLAQDLTVERLAARCAMSGRTFARLFAAEVGATPAKAVERLRIDAARAAVEAGSASLDQIARQTGFTDADHMRRAFVRSAGLPPQALRRAGRPA